MLVLTTATQSQILPRAECLPHTNPRMVKHHLHHLGNNHSFEQICLLEGNTSLLGVTLFPLSFWAEKAKPACSLPSFSQPLSGCVSLTDRWIDSDFLVGVFINLHTALLPTLAPFASTASSTACALFSRVLFLPVGIPSPRAFSWPSCLHMFSLACRKNTFLLVSAPSQCQPGHLCWGNQGMVVLEQGRWKVLHGQLCHQDKSWIY